MVDVYPGHKAGRGSLEDASDPTDVRQKAQRKAPAATKHPLKLLGKATHLEMTSSIVDIDFPGDPLLFLVCRSRRIIYYPFY